MNPEIKEATIEESRMTNKFLVMRNKRKEKQQEFLRNGDISACPRCGETQRIWHTFGKGKDLGYVTGMACTRCFWTCGDFSILAVINCKATEIVERWRCKKKWTLK